MKGLRKWSWGELPVYNGFTHAERVRGWQVVSWMIDNGLRPKAERCCISGSTERARLHSENYYDWHPYELDQSIHLALHRRFKAPAAWQAIVARYAVTGEEWFARLSLEPIDLAAELRTEHGDGIADIFGRAPIQADIAAEAAGEVTFPSTVASEIVRATCCKD